MAGYLNSIHFTPPPAKQRNVPDGLWSRCPICEEFIFNKELERNLKICPKCDYHFPMSAGERIENLLESFTEYEGELTILTPSEGGMSKLFDSAWGNVKSIIAGEALLGEHQIAIIFVENNFNEFESTGFVRFLNTIDNAKNKRLPLITFYDDGTIINPKSEPSLREVYALPSRREWLSFIQIANIVTALEELAAEKIPHITVLTSPDQIPHFGKGRKGGFITSFPLGDIVLMEPKPPNFEKSLGGKVGVSEGKGDIRRSKKDNHKHAIKEQTSQLATGERVATLEDNLIDMYVPRKKLKETLDNLISFFALGIGGKQ